MDYEAREIWELVRSQHGVVTREQLMTLGLDRGAVAHRLRSGRLHPVHRGVYAVGRPDLSRHGQWMAAVRSCGPDAVLSHACAAALHGISDPPHGSVHVTVPPHVARVRPGLVVHRKPLTDEDVTLVERVPATTIERTLLDLAQAASRRRLEAAINAADKHDLVDPDTLRAALERYAGRPGVQALRRLLDRHAFTLTDSELERAFLPIARRAGLGQPETGRRLNGFKVDFFWPDLGLVVETDGLRYHRTPATQARDRLRDQAHTATGLTPLRFTHAQVRYEAAHVRRTLEVVARRLIKATHEKS